MIEVVGSKLVTRRPTDMNLQTTSEEDIEDEATPRVRAPAATEDSDVDIEPYQTPVALTPGNWRKSRVEDDTELEVETSDIEVVEREVKKKKSAPTSAANKVRSHEVNSCSYFVIDGHLL
jgi:hypothetical protein